MDMNLESVSGFSPGTPLRFLVRRTAASFFISGERIDDSIPNEDMSGYTRAHRSKYNTLAREDPVLYRFCQNFWKAGLAGAGRQRSLEVGKRNSPW